MNPNHPTDDLVEQAIEALLNTAGSDEPPPMLVSQVRQAIAERQNARLVNRPTSGVPRNRVSWLALAVTLLLMVTSGWIVGFQGHLLSRIAGEQSTTNNQSYVFYTDGSVELRAPEAQ